MLLNNFSPTIALLVLPIAGLFAYFLGLVVYRLLLHPLARHPGPRLAALSDLYQTYHALKGDRHVDFARLHDRYGPIVRFGPNSLSFNSASALKDIYGFKANVRKARFYEAFWASKDSASTHSAIDKHIHARKRRVLSQAFSDNAIKSMENHILAHIRQFCANLGSAKRLDPEDSKRNAGYGQAINIGDQANYLTFDVLGDLCFGKSFGMLERPDNRFAVDMIGSAAHRHLICGTYLPIHEWHLDKLFFRKIAIKRAQYMQYSKAQAAERTRQGQDVARKDFFHHLLNARDPETGRGFSTPELWGESNMLIIAGSDTTATALSATFFYLTHNPTILERLTAAIRTAFPDNDVEAIHSASPRLSPQSLPFLRACIDEAMRLSPSVPGLLPREVLPGDLQLTPQHPNSRAALTIPAGTIVGVPHYALHRNPANFPHPNVYDPDRWIPGSRPDVTAAAVERAQAGFCPFSVGPRGCIGKGMAYAELSTTVARTLWMYDLRLSPLHGRTGEGNAALGAGRERSTEFQLWDTFTSWKTGPCVEFKAREMPSRG